MPRKEGVQHTNKMNVVNTRAGDDVRLRNYLMRHFRFGIADLRKVCSFTPDDWAFYKECRDYEFFANRDEDDRDESDKTKNANWGRPGIYAVLNTALFEQLKEESGSKKIDWQMYISLTLNDHMHEDGHLPAGPSERYIPTG